MKIDIEIRYWKIYIYWKEDIKYRTGSRYWKNILKIDTKILNTKRKPSSVKYVYFPGEKLFYLSWVGKVHIYPDTNDHSRSLVLFYPNNCELDFDCHVCRGIYTHVQQ